MGKYFTNEKMTKKVFSDLVKMYGWYNEALEADPDLKKNITIDDRDFFPFILAMNWNKGSWKKEEFLSELAKESKKLKENPKEEIDKFYDIAESYSISGQKNNTYLECMHALLYFKLNQSIGNIRDNHPEIIDERYESTIEGMRKYDALDARAVKDVMPSFQELKGLGIEIDNFRYAEVIEGMEPEEDDMIPESEFLSEKDKSVSESTPEFLKVLEGKKNVFEYKLPLFIGHFKEMVENHKNPDAPCDPRFQSEEYSREYMESFFDMVCAPNSHARNYMAVAYGKNSAGDSIFIDGKPLKEGVPKNEDNPKEYNRALSLKLAQAFNEGHAVDVVSSYDVKGKIIHKITPVQAAYTKEYKQMCEDQYCEKHHIGWIHRHLFNFGIWKIEYPDTLGEWNKKNNLTMISRHADISNYLETVEEPKYNINKAKIQMEEIQNKKDIQAFKEQNAKKNMELEKNPIEVNEAADEKIEVIGQIEEKPVDNSELQENNEPVMNKQ